MFEEFLSNLSTHIQSNPWLAVAAVFLGGVLTATNPCVLAMIPLMLSFVSGRREEGLGLLRALGYSLVFVIGLCLTFSVLVLLAGVSMGLARKLIESARVTRVTERQRQGAGVLIIGVGG